jgi:hypothetical protein
MFTHEKLHQRVVGRSKCGWAVWVTAHCNLASQTLNRSSIQEYGSHDYIVEQPTKTLGRRIPQPKNHTGDSQSPEITPAIQLTAAPVAMLNARQTQGSKGPQEPLLAFTT